MANSQKKFVPGDFLPNFKGLLVDFQLCFRGKNYYPVYIFCLYLSTFHSLFYFKFRFRLCKTRLLAIRHTVRPPLIDHSPLCYGQMLMRGRSASEHIFSGVGCNFRVLWGIFLGVKKIQGLPGFASHPTEVHTYSASETNEHLYT